MTTIPADNSCVPMFTWFVVMLRSVVMVDVSAALMFTRSICREKKARPRTGSRMRSILHDQ